MIVENIVDNTEENAEAESEDKLSMANIPKIKKVLYFAIKRLFDIFCSLLGVIILIPVVVVTKICYLASGDNKSIIIKQKRIGKEGVEFDFYKIRSMVYNADEVLIKLLEEDPQIREEYSKNKKIENDPRITKVGSFLRKTSLDEFPQFINVLKGDMSVVGNRPYLPREKEDMGNYFDNIVRTKCGIISYWAVMGRNELSFEERLKLESYYSNVQSFKMDIKIFIKVFAIVLFRKGAK